jgi:hypothetical protein
MCFSTLTHTPHLSHFVTKSKKTWTHIQHPSFSHLITKKCLTQTTTHPSLNSFVTVATDSFVVAVLPSCTYFMVLEFFHVFFHLIGKYPQMKLLFFQLKQSFSLQAWSGDCYGFDLWSAMVVVRNPQKEQMSECCSKNRRALFTCQRFYEFPWRNQIEIEHSNWLTVAIYHVIEALIQSTPRHFVPKSILQFLWLKRKHSQLRFEWTIFVKNISAIRRYLSPFKFLFENRTHRNFKNFSIFKMSLRHSVVAQSDFSSKLQRK